MHADWDKDYDAADYTSNDEEKRAYRTQNSPKAKRAKPPRQKTPKPSGIYKRRNNRWAW